MRGVALPEGAALKVVSATQEPNGWHASIQFEAAPKAYAEPTRPMVGIDGGLAHLATLSDGDKVEHPRLGRKAHGRIRRLNRERGRRCKGSVNRKRTAARLARAHRHVADARRDATCKATRELVDRYEGFAVEDLSLRGMMRTRMARANRFAVSLGSLADAGLGGFLRVLRHWVLDKHGDPAQPQHAVRAYDPGSGRTLDCWTTEPGVQIYTAGPSGRPLCRA